MAEEGIIYPPCTCTLQKIFKNFKNLKKLKHCYNIVKKCKNAKNKEIVISCPVREQIVSTANPSYPSMFPNPIRSYDQTFEKKEYAAKKTLHPPKKTLHLKKKEYQGADPKGNTR